LNRMEFGIISCCLSLVTTQSLACFAISSSQVGDFLQDSHCEQCEGRRK
jgi:hypothetical protein